MGKNVLSPGWAARLAAAGIDPSRDLYRLLNTTPTVDPTVAEVDRLTLPSNSTELAEMIGSRDNALLNKVMASPAALTRFIDRYATAQQAPDGDLARMVREQTQAALLDMLRDNGANGDQLGAVKRLNLDPQDAPIGVRQSHRAGTAYNKNAAGAALDKAFPDAGSFFKAVKYPSRYANGDVAKIWDTYSSVDPAAGGFLIPEVLRAQLLSLALENSVVRPRAFVVPMDSLRVPFPIIDETTHSGSVFGGMIGYWTEESAQLTMSEAKFGQVVLDAKKLTGYAEIPNELFADSVISFSAFVERMWPLAIAYFEDVAFMTGSGVGQPIGWLNALNNALVVQAKQTGQATNTVVWENVVNMYARMLPASLNSAVWIVSPDALPELFTMGLSVGTGGSSIFVMNGAGAPPMTLLGRPVIVSEKANKLSSQGDLSFVDLGYYLVGDRQAMTAVTSDQFKFRNDQTAFRIVERVDGRPWIQSALTPQNGSTNTLSPFVTLGAR